ncbi:helix-turn-helix transcriptional regulator [Bacillus cytotoxicus]|uniref:helix-turn-helix domain-containing protein n=1 Tax=Bacillus cereus group sp. BfR-BA-01492 TaxID=2920361 RepID=UPI001F5A65C4|nr:helix-turn-helix transcriptional regulator [Bacillus cereus group sp. BfR-BA-01492]EMA6342454.1 helix-turn-helix transcriptional regulator [Bacillus cytotoxicus]
MSNIGEKIQFFRKKSGYSRQQLAEDICDTSTLYRIEKGLQSPRLDILQNICTKLNIPIDYIISYEDENTIKYLNKIKLLCRENLYYQDFISIQYLLEECDTFLNKHPGTRNSNLVKLIDWLKGIIFHKVEHNLPKAEKTFRTLLPNNKIITELDINIANSLSLILIEQKNSIQAIPVLTNAINTFENLPFVEDKSLYPRVGYNLAHVYYLNNQENLSLDIAYHLQYYLISNHLSYSAGEINHMLGILHKNKKDLVNAKKYLENALSIFTLESKSQFIKQTNNVLTEINRQLENSHYNKLIK